jgi:hypothetical protein
MDTSSVPEQAANTGVTEAVLPPVELPSVSAAASEDLTGLSFASIVLDHHLVQEVAFPLACSNLGLNHQLVAKMVGGAVWASAYPENPPAREDPLKPRVLGALRLAITRMALKQDQLDAVRTDQADALTAAMQY